MEWDHEGCNPMADAEHHRLYRMMNRLEPVIVESRRETAIVDAVRILNQRMAEHFAVEEELFVTADWSSRQVMKDDHRRLLALLGRMAELPHYAHEDRRRLFTDFLEALVRHDNDVDAPLFRRQH